MTLVSMIVLYRSIVLFGYWQTPVFLLSVIIRCLFVLCRSATIVSINFSYVRKPTLAALIVSPCIARKQRGNLSALFVRGLLSPPVWVRGQRIEVIRP